MTKQIKYFLQNYKMVLHLLFGTSNFGVNNKLWSESGSIFASKGFKKITCLIKNYKMIKVRAFSGFIPLNDAIDLFPNHAEKYNYKKISTDTIKLNKTKL